MKKQTDTSFALSENIMVRTKGSDYQLHYYNSFEDHYIVLSPTEMTLLIGFVTHSKYLDGVQRCK